MTLGMAHASIYKMLMTLIWSTVRLLGVTAIKEEELVISRRLRRMGVWYARVCFGTILQKIMVETYMLNMKKLTWL
jgi:hypothetical protein